MTRILLALLLPCFSLAENYYVAPVKGKNIEKQKRDSVRELFENSLMDEGQTIVQERKKADYWISSSIMKLGEKYMIVARKVKGKKVIESRKRKFESFENVDLPVGKIVGDLVPLKENDVSQVVEKPADVEKDKKKSDVKLTHHSGMGGGISVFKDYGSATERGIFFIESFREATYSPHFGLRFAATSAFIVYNFFDRENEDGSEKSLSADTMFSFHFGPVFYLFDKDFSPFVGLYLGGGAVFGTNITDELQYTWSGELGIAMFRTTDNPIKIKLGIIEMLNSSQSSRPKSLTLAVNFAF